MSYSSLYVIDNNFNGEEIKEFKNSWLFSPMVLDCLYQKYMPEEAFKNGYSSHLISASMFNKSLYSDLNTIINNCNNMTDRIMWEICNQQILSTEDLNLIINSIKEFKDIHIDKINVERVDEIVSEFQNIDIEKYPYFVWKNTSCDDGVEYWFEDENCEPRSLKDFDKNVCEFVIIEGSKIYFKRNLEFFEEVNLK